MPAPCLPLVLALAPALQAPGGWTPLELPALCSDHGRGPWLPALADGAHVLLERFEAPRRPTASAELPASQLAQVLEAEARRQGRQLVVYAGAPPLLAQGPEADVEWARAELAGLERAARALEIELDVRLVPARLDGEGGDELPLAEGARRHSARVRSGDPVAFGERVHHRFVASYDVEVSSDSGVAAPVVGSVFTGATVHVRAARVDGGRRVHLVGLLDLSEAREWQEFDPDTIDLGLVQQPVVDGLQVAFSGVVESGGELAVDLRGTSLARPDWALRVRATTAPDRDEGPWRVMDLALVAETPRLLPPFELGTGLDEMAAIEALGGSAAPASPSALFLRSESLRRGSARGAPGNAVPTERTVLLPAAEAEAARELGALVRALEAGRLATRQLTLTSGGLSISFPVAAGEAARVVAGTERTWLVDYDTQIAPDTWMPAPRVERAFDGLVWQGLFEGEQLESTWAASRTTGATVRSKEAANMGVLQLPSRSVEVQRGRRTPGQGAQVLLESSGGSAGLELAFPRG